MTKNDLHIIDSLLERTDSLPDILHLRAPSLDYELTSEDEELLLTTYQRLDDILKEVVAFINVKFPGRQGYINSWNKIDFDAKIAGMKVVTNDGDHIKSAWRGGIFDLKSLLKALKHEVTLLVDQDNEKKNNPLFYEKVWEDYFDALLEKRADQADFFLDIIMEKGLIKLDKTSIKRHFKRWFKENHDFDLQIKDGNLVVEDGDMQIVPELKKDSIPEFLKWFKNEGENFIEYLKDQDVNVKEISKEDIVNHGNLTINNNTQIKNQTLEVDRDRKESMWTKANVVIALIVAIATIVGIIWTMFN